MTAGMVEYSQVVDSQVYIYIHLSEDHSPLYVVYCLSIQLDISDYTIHPMYFPDNLSDNATHTFLVSMYNGLFHDHIDLLHNDLGINDHIEVPKILLGIRTVHILYHDDLEDIDKPQLRNHSRHHLHSHSTVCSPHPIVPLDIFLHR